MDLWVIFITGLTTGGISCLAIQGGLLASALAQPVPGTAQVAKGKGTQSRRKNRKPAYTPTGVQLTGNAMPVVYFLLAKLLSHVILGFALGMLGQVAQLSPTVRALMQMAAGIFMIGTALNMLNVHPFFRHFVIQPPRSLTRLVRNQSKSREVFTPALLGFLTVLIPCGTTQAMAVLAVSSGNALTGAAIMGIFVLGTSPTFFVLGFLATRISGRLKQTFALATATLILILGFVSIDTSLNLMGASFAPSRVIASVLGLDNLGGVPGEAVIVNGVQELTINAVNTGYVPNRLVAKKGQPIRLKLVTRDTYSCSSEFVIPSLNVYRVLPPTGEIVIDLPPQYADRINFSCGMGMYTGSIRLS